MLPPVPPSLALSFSDLTAKDAVGIAIVVVLALLVLAAAPAYADDPHGFNGTVKIHAEPGESEPIMANEPHVCAFHIHGFNFDAASTGWWTITAWPPTGDGSIPDGFIRTDESVVRVHVVLADFLAVKIILRIEVLDLTRELRLELRGVKPGDRACPADTRQQAFPVPFKAVANRCQRPQASYYNPS